MEGTCTTCGEPLAADDMYCGGCGQPGTAAAATAAAATATLPRQRDLAQDTAPQPAAQPPPPPPPPPAAKPQREWPGIKRAAPVTGSQPPRHSAVNYAEAALGERAANETYEGLRLTYGPPEAPFDPLGNNRLLGQFAIQFAVYVLFYFIGGFLALLGLAVLGVIGILSVGVGARLLEIGSVIFWIAYVLMFLLIPVPTLLSEWKLSVDDKGAAAPMTFEHITWAARRHETPLDSVQVRRLRLPAGESRDYLELRRGLFTGFISCFAYGRDLYVGWTFYIRVSVLRYMLMKFARIWQSFMQRGSDLYVTLRYDSARAMREAMHSVAREGIDVAVGQLRPQGQGIIGTTVGVAVSELDN
jgi:hypothetical protein